MIKNFINFIISNIFKFKNNHPLFSFMVSRTFSMIVLLFFLGLMIFALMQLSPGDIVDNYVRSRMMMESQYRKIDNMYTEQEIKAEKHRLGLDQPFYIQYQRWLYQVFVKHDLGRSLISNAPVLFLIQDRMINSLILNIISLVFLTIISFILAIYFSTMAYSKVDIVAALVALFFHAFPSILLFLLLQMFASATKWFPVNAYPDFPFHESPLKFSVTYLYYIFIPLLGSFISGIGGTMRMIRATMLDQLGQPYITSLRSRGIDDNSIYFKHAFRNTLNPYITSSSNILASLFSGSLILEIMFSYPGIGRLMYESVRQEDINLVLTTIMFISFLILLGMLLSDIMLALVDPRIKYGKT